MEPREYTPKELKRNAAIVVAVIVAFSCVLIYGVRHLDALAHLAPASDATTQEAPDEEAAQESEELEYPTEPFYVLLIGSDTREGTAFYTGKGSDDPPHDDHADVLTLMRIDPTEHVITLVTIPRDTVLVGSDSKINDTLLGNHPEQTVAAVERLTGVQIDHYLLTTFTAFELLVDSLGGVTVDVPKTIAFTDPVSAETVKVKEGKNRKLDGAEALVLARVRKDYGEGGDRVRQQNVRNLEEAIIKAALEDPQAVAEVLSDIDRYIETDMDAAEMAMLVTGFTANADDVTFYSCCGPYNGGENEDGVWVIEEDIPRWTAIMQVVDAGEDPSAKQ